MERQYPTTALLLTSSNSDVSFSGANKPVMNVTGLNPMRIEDIASITIKKAKAEVAQVVTIGGTTPTITYDTKYIVAIKRPSAKSNSTFDDFNKKYVATLAASAGSAAADRQAIYDSLASKINADTANGVVADAGAGGTGMTITDDGDYFQGIHNPVGRGKTTVKLLPDPDTAAGFVDATHNVITTAAVYPIGQGADLQRFGAGLGLQGGPVSESKMNAQALSAAVSGQNYNYFSFESVVPQNVATFAGYKIITQDIYVDNGEGTVTTNLAGYLQFERKVEWVLYGQLYKKAPNTIAAFFDTHPQKTKVAGGLPTGTAGDENLYSWSNDAVEFIQSILGTQTILYSNVVATGLRLTQDAADNDGMEFHTAYGTNSKHLVTVGNGSWSVRARIKVGDVSDADEIMVGFREAVAVEAAFTGYEDYACITIDAGDVKTRSRDAAGTAQIYDTTVNVADAGSVDLEVRIKPDGTTEYLVNDVIYTPTTAVVHTAGKTMIPFIRVLNAAAGDPEADYAKLLFINDIVARD